MTEAQLWKRIRPGFTRDYDRAYRVEAVATPGFPDAIWCPYLRGPVFIELKVGPLRFRPAQERFIRDLHQLGIIVWVIWQHKPRQFISVFKGKSLIDDPKNAVGETLDNWMERMRGS